MIDAVPPTADLDAVSEVSTRHGLRRRVTVAFGLFAWVLSMSFGIAVWVALHFSEDRLIEHMLELEMDAYLERRAADPEAPLPSTHWLGATWTPRQLPEDLHHFADHADGFHEADLPAEDSKDSVSREYALTIRTLDNGQRLYFYIDTEQAEILDGSLTTMGSSLVVFVVVITAFGIVLGYTTAQKVIAPVIELAARVRRQDELDPHRPDQETALSSGFGDDEVGLLARAFDHSLGRSRAFLERERRFTRDASHELRSPVTIVRGAVELMEGLPQAGDPAISRPLARIRRAADDMSNLIEAFLWLAREEALSDTGTPRSLSAEVDAVVERYGHLLDGKAVELIVQVDEAATVTSPQGVLGIVLGNLVANAFFYTQAGHVTIRGDAHRIDIIDGGPGIAPERRRQVFEAHHRGGDSQGFGLGLAICHDLCLRFAWRLELTSPRDDDGRSTGTRASVHF